MIVTFFITLNFNNKVLYAPSDYKDETNYIKVFKYDQSRQEKIEVTVSKDNSSSILLSEFTRLNDTLNQRLTLLETKLNSSEKSEGDEESLYGEELSHLVVNFPNVNKFIHKMRNLGININLYEDITDQASQIKIERPSSGKAIWLGRNVPFKTAKTIITQAKEYYPHLQYIHISGDLNDDDSPYETHNRVFIGGATSSATEMFNLKPLTKEHFQEIKESQSKDELFAIIRKVYP